MNRYFNIINAINTTAGRIFAMETFKTETVDHLSGIPTCEILEQELHRRMLTLLTCIMLGVSGIYVIWVLSRAGLSRPPLASGSVFLVSLSCLVARRWVRSKRLLDIYNVILFAAFGYAALHQDGLYSSTMWWLVIPILFSIFSGSYWLGGLLAAAFMSLIAIVWVHGDTPLGSFSLTSPSRAREQMALSIVISTAVMLAFVGICQAWIRQLLEALRKALTVAGGALDARSLFMAKVSHEIRTPLNGMIGATDLLKSGGHSESQRQQLMAIQNHSARMLLALVNDILEFSKISAGSMTTEDLEFSARRAIFQCVELFSVQAFDKKLDITCSLDPEVPRLVIGDEHRLRQIITNLVSNAIKFTDAGGVHIHVELGPDRQPQDEFINLRFEITDTGIGIPGDKISSLFKAYNQVDTSVARVYGGTGLGLAISNELANLMGGNIEVSSRAGRGTVFTVTLAFKLPVDSKPQQSVGMGSSERALVASEWKGLRQHMRSILADLGIAVSTSNSMPCLDDVIQSKATVVMIDAELLANSRDAQAQLDDLSAEGVRIALIAPLGSDIMVGTSAAGVTLIYKPVRRSSVRDFLLGKKLDLAARNESLNTVRSAPTVESRWLHVLIAEDNPVNQIVVQGMLANMNCTAVIAHSGNEAVLARSDQEFDVILMDVEMPDGNGLEATRAIRAMEAERGLPRTPIFGVTGMGTSEDIKSCLAAGMDRHLPKPFGINQLRAELSTLGKAARV